MKIGHILWLQCSDDLGTTGEEKRRETKDHLEMNNEEKGQDAGWRSGVEERLVAANRERRKSSVKA